MKIPLIREIQRRSRHLAFDNPLYNWSLKTGVPARIVVIPPDSGVGSAETGRLICGGVFDLEGARLALPFPACWDTDEVSGTWLAHLHSFSWLRDLKAAGGEESRRAARTGIESWMNSNPRWDALTWRADITGARIAHWISFYDFYEASVDEDFRIRLFDSIARQARHLSRLLPADAHCVGMLHAIRGLAYAGLAFEGREGWLEQALDLLQLETDAQILPDGGHISRSPRLLLEALQIFVDIRAALGAGEYPVPEQITHTIDRMAQALRFFRYPDRKFALMNGAQEGNEDHVDAILNRANAQGRILRGLPQSGYERLTQGRSILMMDTGAPAPFPHDIDAHAAPLAIEFIYGRERLFVSCGAHPVDNNWNDALRATAAHCTLDIDRRSAAEIGDDGHLMRRPRQVNVTREDSRDSILVEASHDGYAPVNGITHRRRLYMSKQGHDLRGEDGLTCSVGLTHPLDVAIRFHLHPKVQVSLVQDGCEALIKLAGGAGWRFVHAGGVLALEDSVYLGSGIHPRKTKQLVIHARMESDRALVKWAMQREGV